MSSIGDERDPVVLLVGDGWPEGFRERLAAAGRYVVDTPPTDRPFHVARSGSSLAEILFDSSGGWDEEGDRLAARSIEKGDPTGWFDQLYAAGAAGETTMPWDRTNPHSLLLDWASRGLDGSGKRAVVVGCGLGADPAYLAQFGFDTIGFDIAETAIGVARQRFASSGVDYVVADLLDLPRSWHRAFDLVVEIITVQALPDPPRRAAIVNVGRLVAPAGTLLVIALRGEPATAPPFPLSHEEIEAFATDGLLPVKIEALDASDNPRWRAEFRRP